MITYILSIVSLYLCGHGGHPHQLLIAEYDHGSSHKTSVCSNSIKEYAARASASIYLCPSSKLSKPDDDDDDGLSIAKQTPRGRHMRHKEGAAHQLLSPLCFILPDTFTAQQPCQHLMMDMQTPPKTINALFL